MKNSALRFAGILAFSVLLVSSAAAQSFEEQCSSVGGNYTGAACQCPNKTFVNPYVNSCPQDGLNEEQRKKKRQDAIDAECRNFGSTEAGGWREEYYSADLHCKCGKTEIWTVYERCSQKSPVWNQDAFTIELLVAKRDMISHEEGIFVARGSPQVVKLNGKVYCIGEFFYPEDRILPGGGWSHREGSFLCVADNWAKDQTCPPLDDCYPKTRETEKDFDDKTGRIVSYYVKQYGHRPSE